MTALFHALEHVSMLIVLGVLVLLAWGWVKLRQFRLHDEAQQQIAREIRQSRVGWHAEEEADGE